MTNCALETWFSLLCGAAAVWISRGDSGGREIREKAGADLSHGRACGDGEREGASRLDPYCAQH